MSAQTRKESVFDRRGLVSLTLEELRKWVFSIRYPLIVLIWVGMGALIYAVMAYAPQEMFELLGAFAVGKPYNTVANMVWFDLSATKFMVFNLVIVIASRLPSERHNHTLDIYVSKPVSRFTILLSRYITYFFVLSTAFVICSSIYYPIFSQAVVDVALNTYGQNVEYPPSVYFGSVATFIGGIAFFTALGMLISVLVKKSTSSVLLTFIVGMMLVIINGFRFMDTDMNSFGIYEMSRFFPPYYATFLTEYSTLEIGNAILSAIVLTGSTIFLFILTVIVFKKQDL